MLTRSRFGLWATPNRSLARIPAGTRELTARRDELALRIGEASDVERLLLSESGLPGPRCSSGAFRYVALKPTLPTMSRETGAASEGRLPGELPDQPTAEDALHWVVVYTDLSTAVRNLLASSGLEDRAHLETMLMGFERRRRWWARRI